MAEPFASLAAQGLLLAPELAERAPTPALVIDLALVRHNLRRMLELLGQPRRWRPHVKTAKLPEVFAELARAGVRRFKCATVREAHHLLAVLEAEGIEDGDVLLAHPLLGPGLARLGELARAHRPTRVSVLAEDPRSLGAIPVELDVFVDVNSGMNRTGIPIGDLRTIRRLARAAGERLAGLHVYDGHRHEPGEALRRRAAHAEYERVLELAGDLAQDGSPVRELCTSGTPSFRSALAYEPFEHGSFEHTVSPGTVVYHDLRSELENEDLGLVPAARILARVVSHPAPGIATLDSGSKAIGADAGDPCAWVVGWPGLEALRPSEEHLPLEVRSGQRPPRGTLLELVPRHVCTTVNLADEAWLLDAGVARTARVAARGH